MFPLVPFFFSISLTVPSSTLIFPKKSQLNRKSMDKGGGQKLLPSAHTHALSLFVCFIIRWIYETRNSSFKSPEHQHGDTAWILQLSMSM